MAAMVVLDSADGKIPGAPWKVAVATQDGLNVDADLDSAESFALFDVDTAGARFVGLIGCSTSRPRSSSRVAALAGCEVLLSLAAAGCRHRSPLRARLVELSEPLPITEAVSSLRVWISTAARASRAGRSAIARSGALVVPPAGEDS